MAEQYYPQLIDSYCFWNQKEAGFKDDTERRLRRICENKATAVAETILRTSTEANLELLRGTFQQIALTPSAQYLATALICLGNASDIVAIIKRNGATQTNRARESSTGNRPGIYTVVLYRLPAYMR
jgi:hypothetical protein